MIFSKPPIIAYSRSENLRDSLVQAKFPTREEGDYLYDDLLRNEEDPPSSPTLQTLQDLELESKGFNVFIDFEITEDQNTQGPTPSSRRQDHKDHSSCPFQADWRNILDKHRRWSTSWTDQSNGPHSRKHIIMKG